MRLCSLGRGGRSPWGGPATWAGDAWPDVEAAGEVAAHLGLRSWAVPRRRRSSKPAGEGGQVGCCVEQLKGLQGALGKTFSAASAVEAAASKSEEGGSRGRRLHLQPC